MTTKQEIVAEVRKEIASFCNDERMEEFDDDPVAWLNFYAPQISDIVIYREDFGRWCPTDESTQERLLGLFSIWFGYLAD